SAERRLASNPDYLDELRRWTHRPGRDDGIAEPPPEWPSDRVSDVPLRDFTGTGRHRVPGGPGRPPTVERDTLVLLGSVPDDAYSHIETGRAMAWLLLRITVEGLSAQPLGQALDDAEGRHQLATDLRLI